MYIKSSYPDPGPLPKVNAHYIFFKRPEQAQWPDFTTHIEPLESLARVTGKHVPASLMTPNGRLNYRDFVRNVEDLSTGLGAPVSAGGLGLESWDEGTGADDVGPGGKEIVGIMSENCSEYITLIHACVRIAVPYALISSYSTSFELKHTLTLSKATRLFIDEKFLKLLLPVAKEVGLSEDRIYVMREGTKKTGKPRNGFRSIIEHVRAKKIPLIDIRPAGKDTLAYLVFSSGTSGRPKAVMISHGNLIYSVSQALVVQQAVLEVYTPPVPKTPEGLPVALAFLPLHHTYGLHAYAFRSCLAPSTLVLLPKWDIRVALDAIPRYRVSSLPLIPSVVHQLVNHPGIEKVDFSSVIQMGSGAAYLPPELSDKLMKMVSGEITFAEGYGMSECTIAAISQPHDGMLQGKAKKIPGCTGLLIPGMEARLLRSDSAIPPSSPSLTHAEDCAVNEPGELWLRSGNIALGYWNNPKATSEAFIDGWLKTGDRFRVDENENFWFADRAKDILKVSGAQVSPVEIEDCLLAHPSKLVSDATVAGVSGSRTVDEKAPRAWIVLSAVGSGKTPDKNGKRWSKAETIKELDRWHKENLSKYKYLRGGIEVVNEIPKNPTGKVLRRVLQDKYEKQSKSWFSKAKL